VVDGGGGGGGALGGLLRLLDGTLEALLTTQVAAVLEHVSRVGMQRPVTALTCMRVTNTGNQCS